MSLFSLEIVFAGAAFLALFRLLPGQWRVPVITGASCLLYGYLEPYYFLPLLVLALAGHIGRNSLSTGPLFWFLTAASVAFLVVAKVSPHSPLGVSFLVFGLMSYFIEVRQRRYAANEGLTSFLGFTFFFPHMPAGPICRPHDLLPQLGLGKLAPTREQVRAGMWLIAWAAFKKLVLADTLGEKVGAVFSSPSSLTSPGGLLLLALGYGQQIYLDFSAYTDAARGIAKLLGIELPINFNFPYFARSLSDFWRRWHMTLSTWFRDYVYVPLGGNQRAVALLAVFVLSALWHGIAVTFVVWGLWHWLGLSLLKRFALPRWLGWASMMVVVQAGWLFFAAADLATVQQLFTFAFTSSSRLALSAYRSWALLIGLAWLCDFIAYKVAQRKFSAPQWCEDLAWMAVVALTFLLAAPAREFIYFRF